MTSINNNVQKAKRSFHLSEHPWLSLLVFIIATVLAILLSSKVIFGTLEWPEDSPVVQFAMGMSYHILTIFILVPFVLHLPRGKRTYRQYLDDIGLSRMRPFFKLVLLAFSCYVILALSQIAASLVYRIFEGQPVTWDFIRRVIDFSGDLPPGSPSLLISIPSAFEEAAFRGIVLTTFLNKYSERKSIVFSSLGFGVIHILNLANGADLVWVIGQMVWAFLIGLFYGYAFVVTRSLLPPMIVHYLGNVFIGSLTGYMQASASVEVQVVFGVIFSFGLLPTTLMILWTNFFATKWLSVDKL